MAIFIRLDATDVLQERSCTLVWTFEVACTKREVCLTQEAKSAVFSSISPKVRILPSMEDLHSCRM